MPNAPNLAVPRVQQSARLKELALGVVRDPYGASRHWALRVEPLPNRRGIDERALAVVRLQCYLGRSISAMTQGVRR